MVLKSLTSLFVPILLTMSTLTRVESQDPAIAALNTRVTNINTTSTANKASITALARDVASLNSNVNANYASLRAYATAVAMNCSLIHAEVVQNAADIATLNGDVDSLTAMLADANTKIAKLQSINLIWQSNFKVVNKTFAELRRKVKFVYGGGIQIVSIG